MNELNPFEPICVASFRFTASPAWLSIRNLIYLRVVGGKDTSQEGSNEGIEWEENKRKNEKWEEDEGGMPSHRGLSSPTKEDYRICPSSPGPSLVVFFYIFFILCHLFLILILIFYVLRTQGNTELSYQFSWRKSVFSALNVRWYLYPISCLQHILFE